MKTSILFFSTLFVIALLTTKCHLDPGLPKENQISHRGCIEISEEQAELFGQNHNMFLDEINNTLTCSGSKSADFNQAIITVGNNYNVDSNLLNYIINNWTVPPTISYEEYDFSDPESVEFYVSKLEYATLNSEDFDDFSSKLDTINSDVNNELSCFDRTFMLVCISIAKSSAYYWLPTSLGGEGNWGPCGTGQPMGLSIWRRIVADWVGAGLSFKPSLVDLVTPSAQTWMDVSMGSASFSAADGVRQNGGGSW